MRPSARWVWLILLAGCAHEEPATYPVANEPTIESKIPSPSYAAGVVGTTMSAQADVTPQAESILVAERSAPSLVAGVARMFQSHDKPAEPEPQSQAGKTGSEKLVVEAWVTLVTDDVQPVAQSIRQRVREVNGHITEDRVGSAASASWEGQLKVRLPPAVTSAFLDWLAGQGEMVSRRVATTDVSRQFFDHEIALKNLELTLARLQKILELPNMTVDSILRVEQEMTRVRGQIEQIKGTLRFLSDQVAFSTIEIRLTGTRPVPRLSEAKFQVGGRFGFLGLTDAGPRKDVRYGGGAVLLLLRNFSFDLDAFDSPSIEGPTVLATIGGAAYTDFLGGGTRRFGNPYLGLRMGYARLDHQDRFVLSAEVGVELVKLKYLTLDLFVRPMGLLGDDSDFALHGGAGLTVPF